MDTASIARGQSIFLANCASCHGASGRGDGPAAASLDPPPADLTSGEHHGHAYEDLFHWIENGIPGSAMPAFGDKLSDEQIGDVVNYIRVAFEGAPAPTGTPVAKEGR